MFHEQAKVLVVLARGPDILPQELKVIYSWTRTAICRIPNLASNFVEIFIRRLCFLP